MDIIQRLKIEQMVGNGLVLDVGGWADPFLRADYVLDFCPYETRAIGYHGTGKWPRTLLFPDRREGERFTRQTWITHDICSSKPFPFPDKMFDFVVCSHTLEDVRDPIRACSEIARVGKAGYIETPSRLWEQTRRMNGQIGESHHRWLIEYNNARITFLAKSHFLHTSPQLHAPLSFFEACKNEEDKVAWLYWSESFTAEEAIVHYYTEAQSYIASLHIPRKYYLRDALSSARYQWWQIEGAALRRIRGSKPQESTKDLWTWEKLVAANHELLVAKQHME